MSWFSGYIGKNCQEIETLFNGEKNNELYRFHENDFLLIAGGRRATCFVSDKNLKTNFVIVGVPLILDEGDKKLSDNESISQKVNSYKEGFSEFSGHYAGITWQQNEITLLTDQFGLRDIYFSNYRGGVLFSTRCDFILNFIDSEIDFEEFGSKWLLFNQLSKKSVWKYLTRLSSGDCLKIDRTTLETTIRRNEIDLLENKSIINMNREYGKILEELILFPMKDQKLSLSLSGGMDSRIILSYLLNSKSTNWDTHTFGNPKHPDSIIAKQLSEKFGFRHEQINEEIGDRDDVIKELEKYVVQTGMNNTPSSILQFFNYRKLQERNTLIIDGGFGEIWRREFLFQLYFKGKKAIKKMDSKLILNYMRSYKADIFSQGINDLMYKGALVQLQNLVEELPPPGEIGIANWLDFIAIKTRLPNFYGPEQARVDEFLSSYMPLIQKPLLRLLPNMKMSDRENGMMFRKLLKKNNPALAKIPLVKGDSTIPFNLTSLQKRVWSKTIGKFGYKFTDTTKSDFHELLKEYILDTFNSKEVKECSYYDWEKVSKIISAFDKRQNYSPSELDWLLGFEIFRKQGKSF